MCPYYDSYGKICKLYNTFQEGYQLQAYCLSGDNWVKCANYEANKK